MLVNEVLKIHTVSYMGDFDEGGQMTQMVGHARDLRGPPPSLPMYTPRTPPPRHLKRPAPEPLTPTHRPVHRPQPAANPTAGNPQKPMPVQSQAHRKPKWTPASRLSSGGLSLQPHRNNPESDNDRAGGSEAEDFGLPGPSSTCKQRSSLVHSTR